MKKLLILIIFIVLLLSVSGDIVSKNKDKKQILDQTLIYDKYSVTRCENNICTKEIFGKQQYVYEDKIWKTVDKAKSLKGTDYSCKIIKTLESDPDASCLDYNYTSMTVEIMPTVNGDIPLNVYKKIKLNESYDDKKKIKKVKVDSKTKLFKSKKKKTSFIEVVKINKSEELHLGETSTIVTLDEGAGILEDTYVASNNAGSDFGSCTYIQLLSSSATMYGYFKWNIEDMLPYGTIYNATMHFIQQQNYLDTGESINITVNYLHSNFSWVEGNDCGTAGFGELTYNTRPDATYKDPIAKNSFTIDNGDGDLTIDLTKQVIKAYNLSDTSFSIELFAETLTGSPSTADYYQGYSGEVATSTYRPSLVIVYEEPSYVLNTIGVTPNNSITSLDNVSLSFALNKSNLDINIIDFDILNVTVGGTESTILTGIENYAKIYSYSEELTAGSTNFAPTFSTALPNTSYSVLASPKTDSDGVYSLMWSSKTTSSFLGSFKDDTGYTESVGGSYWMTFMYGDREFSDNKYIKCDGYGTYSGTSQSVDFTDEGYVDFPDTDYAVFLMSDYDSDEPACAVHSGWTSTGFTFSCESHTGADAGTDDVNWCAISTGSHTIDGKKFVVGVTSSKSISFSDIGGSTHVIVVNDMAFTNQAVCSAEITDVDSTSASWDSQDDGGGTCSSTYSYIVTTEGEDELNSYDTTGIADEGLFSFNFTTPTKSDGTYDIKLCINITDSAEIICDTVASSITYGSPSDSCTCTDGQDWAVTLSDNCILQTDCNTLPGTVTFTGSGDLKINATFKTNFTMLQNKPSGTKIVIKTNDNGKLVMQP